MKHEALSVTRRLACRHGMAKAKGCGHVAVGNFSKLFPDLAPLAVSEEEAAVIGGPGGLMHDFDGGSPDSRIPAGYIFFAQFVDHDVTLDTTSDLRGETLSAAEVAKLPNIRSASLDLDCVYGFGPEASPHIYDPDRPGRIATNPNGFDLARSPGGVALIGDPRNDENIFVAQMQLLFQRFHNKLFEERVVADNAKTHFDRFEEAQKEARYHYQWIVLFDFLKRICDRDVFRFAAKKIVKGEPFPLCYAPDKHGRLTMPVEFSVAAFRVGHTMVRSMYAANAEFTDVELFDEAFGATGFGPLPEQLAVDWRWMLPVNPHHRPRMAKAFDPLLADEIQNMPRPVVPSNNPNDRALAFRNLLRGNSLGLPSGQAVAAALAAKGYPTPPCDMETDDIRGWDRLDASAERLAENTPLFYYLLRESQLKTCGERFGPTGSALLMEVFGGMLTLCSTSFLHEKDWRPDPIVSKERRSWFREGYLEDFDLHKVIDDDDYYPLELADVARFVGK